MHVSSAALTDARLIAGYVIFLGSYLVFALGKLPSEWRKPDSHRDELPVVPGKARSCFHWRIVPSHLAELQRWKSIIINTWCTSGNEIEVVHNLGSWRVDGDGLT